MNRTHVGIAATVLLVVAAVVVWTTRPVSTGGTAQPDGAVTQAEGPTLAFGGDTMLGRRASAITAERGPADALGKLRPLVRADLAAVNVENVIATGGISGVQKGHEKGSYYYRGRPEQLAVLAEAGIDVVGTGNNHVGDYGAPAIVEQTELLDQAGFVHIGAGIDREHACAPQYASAGDLTVAFLGADASAPYFASDGTTPGTCYLPIDDPAAWTAHFEPRIEEAREHAHLVFLLVHWGPNWTDAPDDDMIRAGHAAIDAGLDGILGTSSHVMHGIELYQGRPIVYDAGSLLFDTSALKGGDKSAVFEFVLSENGVTQVRAHPVALLYGRTRMSRIGGKSWQKSIDAITGRSAALGTRVEVVDGVAVVPMNPPPARPAPADPLRAPVEVNAPYTWSDTPPEQCTVPEVPESARIEPVAYGEFTLVGFELHDTVVVGRKMVWVDTYWTIDQPASGDRFLIERLHPQHLEGEAQIAKRWWGDHEPCDWAWPTSRWKPGVIYKDHFGIRGPGKPAIGVHDLLVYWSDLERKNVYGAQHVPATVEVKPR